MSSNLPKKPPRSQVSKRESESYLIENPFVPLYVVTKQDLITMKLVFNGRDFLAYNYSTATEEGIPTETTFKRVDYPKLMSKLNEMHLLFTVHGMKLTLDKLDKLSPIPE
jgi:hypothetical protein